MNYFKIKTRPIKGTNPAEITKKAMYEFHIVEKRSRRLPSVRCKALGGSRIFLGEYINHQGQKTPLDRRRRLRFLPCAIDLLENTNLKPTTKVNPNTRETLYRLYGVAGNGEKFVVQVAENPKTGNKRLMSSFPIDRTK
ncbi:MAG: hypothetical protein LBU20_01955 [Candidatus Nomurabacteria bacterium]|jgi:hypothetical protein|nr:hypothetical protein [Candidatus Nomurabacteria bacterium]